MRLTPLPDAWIDDLFKEFDKDDSNTIDDGEWDQLVAVLTVRMKERTMCE